SGSEDPAPKVTVGPRGFDVPAGVTLTEGGTTLAVGEPASVVHEVVDGAASAVTVTVRKITKGSIKDFGLFSLDQQSKSSTPFYVRVTVTNEGPAGLGGAVLPIHAHDSRDTHLPASDIIGSFKPCASST